MPAKRGHAFGVIRVPGTGFRWQKVDDEGNRRFGDVFDRHDTDPAHLDQAREGFRNPNHGTGWAFQEFEPIVAHKPGVRARIVDQRQSQ